MKTIYTDGKNTKSIGLENPIQDSWDFVEAMKEGTDTDLYAKVSAVYRAMNLHASAVANLNYALVNEKGDDIDTFEDWKNTIGYMPDPRDLFRRWSLSLFQCNQAYARLDKTNAIKKELFYVLPNSIKVITNKGALSHFERWVDGVKIGEYKPNDGRFVYFWKLDHTTELLPSKNSQFKALSNAAGILYASDWWTKNYFERGAVKPTVLAVKGMLINEKKEDLQSSWAKFVRSLGTRLSELAKIINAESMDVKQIGDGLGDIKDSPVYRSAIENIAMVSGMPLSLLLSNSASYATAEIEYGGWYRDDIIPAAKWMVSKLNTQLPLNGYHFEVRPEQSEPSQEEEVKRAQAFQTYASALVGHPQALSLAAQIVGIDLPAGVEYVDLDTKPEPVEEKKPVEKNKEEPEEEDDTMTAKAWEELDNWKTKAVRYAKRGKAVTFDFKVAHIPEYQAEVIRKRLQFAGTPDEVKSAFDISGDSSDILELAKSINEAVEKIKVDVEDVVK